MNETRFLIHVLDDNLENLADFHDLFDFMGEEYILFNNMVDLTNHIDTVLIKKLSEELPDLFIFDKDSFEEELEDFLSFLHKKKIYSSIIETSSSIEKLIIAKTPDKPSKIIIEKPIKVNQLSFLISLF